MFDDNIIARHVSLTHCIWCNMSI